MKNTFLVAALIIATASTADAGASPVNPGNAIPITSLVYIPPTAVRSFDQTNNWINGLGQAITDYYRITVFSDGSSRRLLFKRVVAGRADGTFGSFESNPDAGNRFDDERSRFFEGRPRQ